MTIKQLNLLLETLRSTRETTKGIRLCFNEQPIIDFFVFHGINKILLQKAIPNIEEMLDKLEARARKVEFSDE